MTDSAVFRKKKNRVLPHDLHATQKPIAMNVLLIVLFAILFPIIHLANGWIFKFAEITPHIGLIYLPAFLRLANVLILGPLSGTLATLLGGLLLMEYFGELAWLALLNNLCSAGGPLVALALFRLHHRRAVELTSLKDLAWLTLLYAFANAALHHTVWSVVAPDKLVGSSQVLWMILGDISGTLLCAYIMKWTILWHRQRKFKSDLLD